MIKWGEVLKKSWQYLKKHHALWYLGILAALTEGGLGSGYSQNSNWQGNKFDLQKYGDQAGGWIAAHWAQMSIVALTLFLVSLIILYISYSSRAGLIATVDDLEEKDREPEFHRDFHRGQKFFWRVLGLTILIVLIILGLILGVTIVAGGLIALSILTSLWFLLLAIPVALASIAGIIVLAIYLNVATYLSYRAIVIENKRIVEAFRKARRLIHDNFGNLILAWLIQTALNAAFAIVLAIVGVIVVAVLSAIGVGLYYAAGSVVVWAYGALAFIALALSVLGLSGGLNAYFSAFWTIVYKKLKS